METRILFIGDIVGSGGRKAVRQFVPQLREEFFCDFCIANGENMAGGNGYSKSCMSDLQFSEIDVFTSGDHTWDQKEWPEAVNQYPNVLRPANFAKEQPGRGWGIFQLKDGRRIGVINLLGRTFMGVASNCPFQAAEKIVAQIREVTPLIFVDFHAEATSDKIALGRFLDGQVSAVIGTHTHVPTADEQIFEGGTAFQSDAGMVGARKSVLGRDVQAVISRYRTGMPARFTVVDEGIRLQGTVVSIDGNGKACRIERVVRDLD